MRILVVGAIKGGTVTVGRAIHSAFREIGLLADFLDFSGLMDEFIQVKSSKDNERANQFLSNCEARLLKKISDFGPDIILGISQSPLNNIKVLSELKKSGITLCYWFVENYQVFEQWKTIAPHFDYFFTIQKDSFWEKLKEIGCHNSYYLPAAFDPNLRSHMDEDDHKIPISFVGAPYPNRVHFFSELARNDFQIYGEGWDKHANPSITVGDRRITDSQARDIYQRSLININLHSSPYPEKFGGGDFVNPRTFDLAGQGVFQLTDMRSLLPNHFELMDELVALINWEDMKKAIEYFLEHDAERKAIAKRAQERALKEHTYKHRAEEILSILS